MGGYIVMVPFMAQGHLIPFVALARAIHGRTGLSVVIANSPLNIKYLKSSVDCEGIGFAELPFSGEEYGLPVGVENTDVVPLSDMHRLLHASTALERPFRALLSDLTAQHDGTPPLCVVGDVFTGWSVDAARELGCPAFTFSTGGVYGTAAYVSIWLNLPHHHNKDSSDSSFSVPGFPPHCRFHLSQLHPFLRAADGSDSWSLFMQPQIRRAMQSDGWLCNSVSELEPLGLHVLTRLLRGLPVWTLGPFLGHHRPGKAPGVSSHECLAWLSARPPASVLYVSFGSQNTISPAHMMELAAGLESSAKPFIWVIRAPLGFDIRGEFRSEWLPPGFQDRTSTRGLLVREWAPQLDILAHASTGAFLSHCGWNSVLESLSQGVPIIGWPMAGEQAYNLKMLQEELGVAVQLTTGIQSKVVAQDITRVVNEVMDAGDEIKRKAAELGDKIRAAVKQHNGSSVKALDDFVNLIQSPAVPK